MMIFTVNGDGLVARVSSCGSADKESACHVGDLGLISGLGRFPGGGNNYAFQCYGLKNSMDCPWGHRVRHD